MSFGFCAGSGVGDCGTIASNKARRMVNTAIASTIFKHAFTCSAVSAGEITTTIGTCSCAELGLSAVDCLKHKQVNNEQQALICQDSTQEYDDLDPATRNCLCGIGACNAKIGNSFFTNRLECKNAANARQNILSTFTNELAAELKSLVVGSGGHFTSTDTANVQDMADLLLGQITAPMLTDIATRVTANLDTTCAGVAPLQTQASKYHDIMEVLVTSPSAMHARSKIEDYVGSALERKDEGSSAFFTSTPGIILAIVLAAGLALGLFLLFWYKPWAKQ